MSDLGERVLILGCGINGAAIARELSLNGVPVCIVDKADLACGATQYSSRLIHGGLRYLEYGEFDLVREALAERSRLRRLAPHLVKPLRLYIPVGSRRGGWFQAARRFLGRSPAGLASVSRGLWLIRAGLWLYDVYARDSSLPKRSVHRLGTPGLPLVSTERFRWLCGYSDAQVTYPERFVVELLEDARQLAAQQDVGFDVFTYHVASRRADVIELRRASGDDTVATLRPTAIVNATGAWVDRTLARLQVSSPQLMGGTKGSHIVLSDRRLLEALGGHGVYAEAADGRPVFFLPFREATLVGTTDVPFGECPASAVASSQEVEYLLDAIRRVFPQVDLVPEDVVLHYSGVRPLPYVGDTAPASITRRHWLAENNVGSVPLYAVIGGKLTTCRSLAEAIAKTIAGRLERRIQRTSRDRPFPGSVGYPADEVGVRHEIARISTRFHLPSEAVQAIWDLCGCRSESLLAGLEPDQAPALEREVIADTCFPRGLVRQIIRREWVQRVADLVERRLMLLYDRNLSERTLRDLARLLAEEQRMPPTAVEDEVFGCRARLHDHFGRTIGP